MKLYWNTKLCYNNFRIRFVSNSETSILTSRIIFWFIIEPLFVIQASLCSLAQRRTRRRDSSITWRRLTRRLPVYWRIVVKVLLCLVDVTRRSVRGGVCSWFGFMQCICVKRSYILLKGLNSGSNMSIIVSLNMHLYKFLKVVNI